MVLDGFLMFLFQRHFFSVLPKNCIFCYFDAVKWKYNSQTENLMEKILILWVLNYKNDLIPTLILSKKKYFEIVGFHCPVMINAIRKHLSVWLIDFIVKYKIVIFMFSKKCIQLPFFLLKVNRITKKYEKTFQVPIIVCLPR